MAKFCLVIFFLIFQLLNETNGDLIWADEFDGSAGTAPSNDNWRFDLGDGTDAGISGWGNAELQLYTNSTENCALDGSGNLVITAAKMSTKQRCYYGPCSYTSARLVSKTTPLYGRIEARIKIPSGSGVWPAFWMIGDDFDQVGWPKSGTIDIMQIKGSQPNKNLGGVHGPKYSGGEKISSMYELTLGDTFDADFHMFTLEWQPTCLVLMVDNDVYFTLSRDDIPLGAEWVFDKPYRIMLNLAVGGNFDGFPKVDEPFPKQLVVDYIRHFGETTHICSASISNSNSTSASHSDGNKHFDGFISIIIAFIMTYVLGSN
ncbi:hypothetical protein CHUAL_009910 [Chamberlinius hualienensis]